jgi:hypothetical protein
MKAIKTLFLLVFSVVVASCFESPEFGDTPNIQFKSIYFGQAATPAKQDSIVVELDFEDGDGDLGLGDQHRNFPFHEYDLFLTDGTSITQTVRNFYSTETSENAFVDVPDGVTGLLVRDGDLPTLPDDECEYKELQLYVEEADKHIFDETYSYVQEQNYYVVTGRFLAKENPDNKNIFVKFYYSTTPNNPDSWVEYKWAFCQSFDGRFTVLADEPTPLSGKLRYTMSSFGFASVMGGDKTWRMEFTIQDRLLRKSQSVSTQFVLEEIRK